MQQPQISVIVTTHERPDLLRQLMEGLSKQHLPPDQFEVWIADDASSTDATPLLSALTLPFRWELMRLPKGGPARGRNRALERANAPLILFINDDLRPEPTLLSAHLQAHAHHPGVKAVLGAFCFPERLRTKLFQRSIEDLALTITTRHFMDGAYYGHPAFWTGNLSIPAQLVRDVGAFDEGFTEPSHEDIDLGIRLERQHGLRVLYQASAAGWHEHPMRMSDWRRQKRMGGRGAWRVHQKHRVLSLGSMERDGKPDLDVMAQLWHQYLQQQPAFAQLEQVVQQLEEQQLTTPQNIRFNGQLYLLPIQQDKFVQAVLETLDQQEQLAGVAEAALRAGGRLP